MWIFFVSQVVTISPCATNTQYALANKCSSLSLSLFRIFLSAFRLSLTFSLSLSFVHNHSLFHTYLLRSFFFFLLFTLMRGLKSSNKVCLLKNSSYSAFLLLRSRFFFLFFCQFIFLVLSISHSHSLVIVMYQNKLNILFTSSLNSVKIFHTFR